MTISATHRSFGDTHVRTLALLFAVFGGLLQAADDSLLLHLDFNEGDGALAQDTSGREHHAKLINTQWHRPGLEGSAVRLTGEASFIQFPAHEDFSLAQDFTLLLWMKVDRFESHGLSLFVRGNYVKGWQTYVYKSFIAMSSRGLGKGLICRRRFASGTGPSYPFTQIAITGSRIDDATTAISFYINGELAEAFTAKGRLPVSTHPLTIGNFASNEGVGFRGLIGQVKIHNRPLSAKEVSADYLGMDRGQPSSRVIAPPVAARPPEAPLPKLTRRRVALFCPNAGFPGTPVRDTAWFERELTELGLQVTRLSNEDLIRTATLTAKRFDTLILPSAHLPFEAEYSVFQYMSGGGNVVSVSCTPTTWKADDAGEMVSKQHSRGWFAPFLIRHLPFAWARRRLDVEVLLTSPAAERIGRLLPPTAGPFPHRRYNLVDRWDLQPVATGRGGDTDVTDGENLFAAADIMLPLYQRPNGEPTDFHIYRYYNPHLFGVTLVELGALGAELIGTDNGGDVLQAVLQLAEGPLPGEGTAEHYRHINQLHQAWSVLGDVFVDATDKLRDATYFAHLTSNALWQKFDTQAKETADRMAALVERKKAWDRMLLAKAEPQDLATATRTLSEGIALTQDAFMALSNNAKRALREARKPAGVPVRSPYGELLIEGYLTLPTNLTMFRTWHFPAMKHIGVNLFSSKMHPWYTADPVIQQQMQGIGRDLGFQYGVTAALKPSSGELRPSDGTIRDSPPQVYDRAKAEQRVKASLAAASSLSTVRIGLAHETGLGLKYWGSQALADYHQYLAQEYADIAALNRHWGSDHAAFSSLALPTRKPTTPAEHAAWEHWRDLREAKFEEYLKTFYDLVKKHDPNLAVSSTVSTGSLQSPLYGVNFYNVTRYQDISGIDGTAVNPPKEWLYLDLTKKPVLTCEWGGLYQTKPLSYVNGKLWEELTGGCIGFNLWIWQFGDCRSNYVNFAGLPTLYGSRARGTVTDARKIQHVILDGHRANPEIGILFSQTTRVHDQGWGAKGGQTTSAHVQAVTNYYAHFLKFHRSARVIAEEKLLEEDISYLKLLIVPQALFLAESVQQKLIAYAADGGKLLIEGRSGQFDNFGQRLDLLFRAGKIAPGHTTVRELSIGTSTWPTAEDDSLFAPTPLTGQSHVLARFGTEPAVISLPQGQGTIIVAGVAAGYKRYQFLPELVETVWQGQDLSPRFMVSDDTTLLREWRHGSDTYLLLTSRTEQPGAVPLQVKIRGDCKIEDYLFRRAVDARSDGNYTTFDTLMANGARVFRIPNGAPADARVTWSPDRATEKTVAGQDDQSPITLPFTGRIYAATALVWGEYVFRNSTIASGIDAEMGETYLSISHGPDVQKKRILAGGDYHFRMRGKAFRVQCSGSFYKFPFHSEVTITEAKDGVPQLGCEMEKEGTSIRVSSGLLQLALEPGRGGRINEIALTDDQINQVASDGALSACTENVGSVPGPFADRPFAATVLEQSTDAIVLELVNDQPIERKTLQKTLTVRKGIAGFRYALRCVNRDERPVQPPFELRWHPELVIGGLADEPDMLVIPTRDGPRALPLQANQSGTSFAPGANWAAVVDRSEKLAYVTTFNPGQVGRIYVWQDARFYDLEVFSPHRQVKPEDSIDLDLGIYFLRGLTGLDVYRDGHGAQADLPSSFDQKEYVRFPVEIGSAHARIEPVTIAAKLWREKRMITDFGGTVEDTVAFDQPLTHILESDLSEYPDGSYDLQVTIKVANRPVLLIAKTLELSGNERSKLLAYYETCKTTIESLAKTASRRSAAGAFDLRVRLEELRGDITAGRLDAAAARCGELTKALTALRQRKP
jgi:hypothetical protein